MRNLADYVWEQRPIPLRGVVDMHTHMGTAVAFPMIGADADSMVGQMDRVGVDKTVCSHQACVTPEVVHGNNEVLAAMERHPGRILGYAITYPVNQRLGIEEVRRCIDKGMRGIKLHKGNGIPYDSKRYEEIWQFADDNRVPVLLHTWGKLDIDSLTPVLKQYRNTPILLGHAGAVEPDAYVECARTHANVILDITFSCAPYCVVEYFVSELDASRVVFGSDMPWMSLSQQIGRVLFADITDDEKKQILVGNPARILANSDQANDWRFLKTDL